MAWAEGSCRNCLACQRFILRQKREKINIIVERWKNKNGKTAAAAAVGSNIPLPSAVNARVLCHCCLHLILISMRRCTAFRLNRRFFLFVTRDSFYFVGAGVRKKQGEHHVHIKSTDYIVHKA